MDDLEGAVTLALARAGWNVDPSAARDHARSRLAERTPTDAQLDDLLLAFACCRGEARAVETVLGLVRRAAATVSWPGTDVGDRCGRVWSHVLDEDKNGRTRLSTFDGRGPLAAWLRVVTTRLAQRERPANDTEPATEDSLAALWAAAAAGAEHDLIKDMYVDRVRAAFRAATAALDDAARALLRLHYAHGLSLESLTRVYGVHRVTLSRRLAAARRQILDRAVVELTRDTAMTEGECRSLLRTLRSRIELSLGRL